jgi:hypothetical protein
VQAEQLLSNLNSSLSELHSPVDRDDQLPDVSIILQTLKTLTRTLTPKRLWFLEAVGRAFQRHHDPLRGFIFLDDTVHNTVEEFARSAKQILGWLQDKSLIDSVNRSLRPAARLDDLIAVDLPKIFKIVFGKECGTGRTGPGPRFIMAVLQESGVRPVDGSDDAVAEAIKQARSRYKKRKSRPELCQGFRGGQGGT